MKPRENITASSNKHTPAHTRLRARREVIRRSRLEDGMIRIEFVKILPPSPEPEIEEEFSRRNAESWQIRQSWSASVSQGEITPPWEAPTPPFQCVVTECGNSTYKNEAFCVEHLFMAGPTWPGGAA